MKKARRPARLFFCAALVLAAQVALGSDRPYLAATSAVVDEDDDRVFALEAWIEASRRVREFRFEPEYNFDPKNAVRVELGIAQDRRFDPAVRSRSAEIEFKHLFTDLARSGYGAGFIVGVDRDLVRGGEEGPRSEWAVGAAGLLSLRLTPDTLTHFNLGGVKPAGERAHLRWAVAVEHELVRRTTLFLEGGATFDENRLVHAGVRHWVRRERFAVDLTVGRRTGEPKPNTFLTVGIALQDIGW